MMRRRIFRTQKNHDAKFLRVEIKKFIPGYCAEDKNGTLELREKSICNIQMSYAILADITRALADQQVSISAASVSVTKDHLAKCKMTFESSDPTHLHHVLATIRKVPSVYDVYRVKQ